MAHDQLLSVLNKQQIELPAQQLGRLEDYCRLLWDWNTKLNLTRHTDYEKFVTRDLVDSLQLAALLAQGESVLDVGTGGGVPGVVLAMIRPDLTVSLCESVGKKAQAVGDIVRRLELPVPIHARRVEELLAEQRFETLVARAVGPLWKLLSWLEPHWGSMQRLLAIKGPKWVEERGEARHRGLMHSLDLRRVATYPMPGTHSESVILQFTRRAPSRSPTTTDASDE